MKIRHLFISPGHNFFSHHEQPPGDNPTVEVAQVNCIAGRGVECDRFFDFKPDYKGHVTFFSQEVFDALCAELKLSSHSPGALRRNIIVEDADLNSLVGQEFEISRHGGMLAVSLDGSGAITGRAAIFEEPRRPAGADPDQRNLAS